MCKKQLYTNTRIFFFLFITSPAAYGGFQAKDRIEAAAAAYTTGMATPDPSRTCDLQYRLWKCWILNPLSQARDWTCIIMDTQPAELKEL